MGRFHAVDYQQKNSVCSFPLNGRQQDYLHIHIMSEVRAGRHMKYYFISCLFACLAVDGVAQQGLQPESPVDTGKTKGSYFSGWEMESAQIQQQLARFHAEYSFPSPQADPYDSLLAPRRFQADEVPVYSGNIISQRLYDLPMMIQMDYNQYVQKYIDLYTKSRRSQMSRMLGLSQLYFPVFEEELDRMDMPLELKYLSVVESALNPHARSSVGATGLWQFMLGTSRMYGLKVDSYVDERRDPYKSTVAACRYLKNAHQEFGDWLLAIASYNCGPGNVRKAIRRSGGQMDFWKIRQYLPRETRGYVPAFIAVCYAFNYAADHNIYPVFPDFTLLHDTLEVTRLDVTLAELSDVLEVDLDILRTYNPELKLDRIPYSADVYVLRVPPQTAVRYAAQEADIRLQYGKRRDQLPPEVAARYAAERRVDPTRPQSSASYDQPPGTILVYYTVRNGDVVGSIAEKYGVSARQVSAWNGLRRYRIRVGQKLKIFTTQSRAEQAGARTAVEQQAQIAAVVAPPPVGQAVYHKVKRGDTLWGIANAYDGVSVSGIQSLNPGLNASDLKIGQNIRIR